MILKRYINNEILRTTGAILVVLILIFISTRFIKYIQLAVDGTISSDAVFSLLGLQIPGVAGFLLPMSFYIAILLTLGRLYSEHEMAIIKSAGIGEKQLADFVFPMALVLALLAGCLSLIITPWANQQVNLIMAAEKAEAKFGVFTPGRFQENSTKTGVMFANSKNNEGVIHGVFALSGFNDPEASLQIQVARSAQIKSAEQIDIAVPDQTKENFLAMQDGLTYVFNPFKKQWQISEYDSYFMRIKADATESPSKKSKALSTLQLLQNPQPADWAELHWRISAPISILILCYLAIPLARSAPRKGKFSRLFPAIMVYLVYALLLMNGRRLIESQAIPVEMGFWWIHLSAIIFTWWMFAERITLTKYRKVSS
ncbi:LPS export ABC transporter permease LptF [Aliikangiella maris]|uniref:LPS export ABC transporter permease LptF n=2 Tax=Aliikangiella maris TaxID=3162458 RepID=A0ABV3MHQ1_9GAMM